MSRSHLANRRDANDDELRVFAERIGWKLFPVNDHCDYFALRRGVWYALEIKNPNCQGHADEFTRDERRFMADVAACGGRILLWRTKDDVLRDSNARVSA